jgi:uncharacterized protein (DUF2235 family)
MIMQNSNPIAVAAQNLVVCCDGTNNTLTGGIEDTNVLLLYAYLRKHTAGTDTTLFYDPGVGSPDAAPPTDPTELVRRRLQRIAGLASGRGIYDNIAEGYRFLMQHWHGPQDRIFCFGFSRGAFTARCVVGLVNTFGMLRPEHEAMLPTLIRIYFSQPPMDEQVYGRKNWTRALARGLHVWLARPDKPASEAVNTSEEAAQVTRGELADEVRRNFSRPASVHWVGVWDTVESVGLPLLFSRDNPGTATFHDKPAIRNVRHALALDEHRFTFLPRLYDSPCEEKDRPDGRTLKQFWFPGVHCDVGGSHLRTETGLSDASLIWMFNEVAPEFGLPRLTTLPVGDTVPYDDLGMPRRAPFPCGTIKRHDALWDTPWWALAGMTLRPMQTQRVWTNGEERRAEEERKRTGQRPEVGIAVDVWTQEPSYADAASVWDERRKAWPALLAAFVAALALFASGSNLPRTDAQDGTAARWYDAPAAACTFALQQLATISPVAISAPSLLPECGPVPAGGLRTEEVWKKTMQHSPAWALAWDFVFIGAIGYLLARIASRGFTFLAGFRWPGQGLPRWRVIGFLPLAAVGADALENVATLTAIAASWAGVAWLATLLLCFVGLLSLLKLVAYAACTLVFIPLRIVIAALPSTRVGKVGRQKKNAGQQGTGGGSLPERAATAT